MDIGTRTSKLHFARLLIHRVRILATVVMYSDICYTTVCIDQLCLLSSSRSTEINLLQYTAITQNTITYKNLENDTRNYRHQ